MFDFLKVLALGTLFALFCRDRWQILMYNVVNKKRDGGGFQKEQQSLFLPIKHLGSFLLHVLYLLHCTSLVSPDHWLVSFPLCPLLEKPTTEVTCANLHVHVRCLPRWQQGPAWWPMSGAIKQLSLVDIFFQTSLIFIPPLISNSTALS